MIKLILASKEKLLRKRLNQFHPFIKKHLDEHVIGQTSLKKVLLFLLPLQACNSNNSGIPIQKSNMLFLGPTGVGKTLIAQTVANFLNVPFIISDATSPN